MNEKPPRSPQARLAEGAHSVASEVLLSLPQSVKNALVSLVLPLASLMVAPFAAQAEREARERPWQTLWVTVPVALVLWLALQGSPDAYRPRGRYLFLLLFGGVVIMGVAFARTLDAPRHLTGEAVTALQAQGRPEWGDWHYWFAIPAPRDPRITVVVLPKMDPDFRRKTLATVIERARLDGATGIALDFYFSRWLRTNADAGFLSRVRMARDSGLAVFVGAPDTMVAGGELLRRPILAGLEELVPPERLGHLRAFQQADGAVRAIPLYLEAHPRQPALALLVASALTGKSVAELAPNLREAMYLLRPQRPFPIVPADDLTNSTLPARDHLRGQFVLVGEDSGAETFKTPFGEQLGVTLQAWAANGLATGHSIRHNQWWVALFVVWAALYWLASLASAGRSRWRLFVWSCALSVASLAFAAAAMGVSRYWIDVFYVLFGIWGFWGLLMIASVGKKRSAPAAATGTQSV